jgi:glycosyltransferase involved in cell wall biosynthesis
MKKADMNEISVSICCLTYNHEALIVDALEGFLMQETTFPFEIVIHDDASTDGTPEIIREYRDRYPWLIRPIFQTENQFRKEGIYPFWTYLYPAARGKYIAECDGDDYWTDPLKLQRQFDFMEAHPDYAMCHHAYLIKNMRTGQITEPSPQPPRDYSAIELIGFGGEGYGIHTSTKMWRNVYKEEKKPELEGFWGDHPINVLMGKYGKCKYIEGIKPSMFRRVHSSSSWTSLSPVDMLQKTKDMYKRVYDLMVETGNPEWIKLRKAFL